MNSPVRDYAPPNGATNYTGLPQDAGGRPSSPIMEDPSADLERELANHGNGRKY